MYSWVLPILPNLDSQELYNQWTMFNPGTTTGTGPTAVAYYDNTNYVQGQASNNTIAETSLKILQCPDDNTVQTGQGNLSYVVNGGFALWHAVPYGWVGRGDRWREPVPSRSVDLGAEDDGLSRYHRHHPENGRDVHRVDFPAGHAERAADSLERQVFDEAAINVMGRAARFY